MNTNRKPRSPRGNVYSATCPSRSVLEVISGKWALLIIPLLAERPIRNNEFLRLIEGVSQKMLTQTLRDLERHGLVNRVDHRTVPPHVEYSITPLGRSLDQVLVPVDRWTELNYTKMLDARAEFDVR